MIIVQLTPQERQTLFATRLQRRRLDRLRARLACTPIHGGYRSPTLSGMPPSSGMPCGLDGDARENEAELSACEQAQAEYDALREQALRIVSRMDDRVAAFSYSYFVDGKSMRDTAADTGKSLSTCWDYLNRIRGVYYRR